MGYVVTFIKKFMKKIKDIFCIPQSPIGLKAMGIQANYLSKVYKSNYSLNRFYSNIISPVDKPFFFQK